MGYYLLDHPNPNYPQTRPRSAWGWAGPTGLVTVHTAEGALDRIAPDTGAENVANFIATRSDAGGYHVLVDTDSTIDMAPDDLMTWHTAAGNLNGPGWGVSAACRSTEWDPDAEWTKVIIWRMGAAIRAFWERQHIDPRKAAVWLTRAQGLAAQVGLVHHGDVQPGDRSDAWATHPRRPELDAMLVAAIARAAGDTTPPPVIVPNPPKELTDMAAHAIAFNDDQIMLVPHSGGVAVVGLTDGGRDALLDAGVLELTPKGEEWGELTSQAAKDAVYAVHEAARVAGTLSRF